MRPQPLAQVERTRAGNLSEFSAVIRNQFRRHGNHCGVIQFVSNCPFGGIKRLANQAFSRKNGRLWFRQLMAAGDEQNWLIF